MRAHYLNPSSGQSEQLLWAAQALSTGRCEEAIDFAAQAIAQDPLCGKAFFITGQASLMLGRLAAAEAAYNRAIRLGFEPAGCWFGLGASQAGQGYLNKALESYTTALRSPGCTDELRLAAYYQLGLLNLELGGTDAALAWLEKTDRLNRPDPNLSQNLFYRLKIHAGRGEHDRASQYADQLLALHPGEWAYLHVKAQVLLQYGTADRLEECRRLLDEAAPLCAAPDARYERLFDLAMAESAQADLEPERAGAHRADAIALLEQAADLEGLSADSAAECRLAAAELEMDAGLHEKALARAEAAAHSAAAQQTKAHAAFLAAELLCYLGREAEAAAYLPLLKAAANSQYRCHGFYLEAYLAFRADPAGAETKRLYQLAQAQFKKAMVEHEGTATYYRIKLEADFGRFDQARTLLRTLPAAQAAELETYIAACEKEASRQ